MKLSSLFATLGLVLFGGMYKYFVHDKLSTLVEFSKIQFEGQDITDLKPDVMCFLNAETITEHCLCLDKLQRTVTLGYDFYKQVNSELECFKKSESPKDTIDCAGEVENSQVASFVCSAVLIKSLDTCDAGEVWTSKECIIENTNTVIEICKDIPHYVVDESFVSILNGMFYVLGDVDTTTSNDSENVKKHCVSTIRKYKDYIIPKPSEDLLLSKELQDDILGLITGSEETDEDDFDETEEDEE